MTDSGRFSIIPDKSEQIAILEKDIQDQILEAMLAANHKDFPGTEEACLEAIRLMAVLTLLKGMKSNG